MSLLALDEALLERAAAIAANELRGLDAVHIASAQQLEDELGVLVSHDERMLTPRAGVPIARST